MFNEKKNENTLSDTDDFWSLDSLLPPTDKRKSVYTAASDTSLADFEIDGESAEGRGEKIPPRKYPPITERRNPEDGKISFEKWLENRREYEKNRHTYGKRVVLEYSPGGRYIKKVTVSEETGRRVGGERFISDGQRLQGLIGQFNGNVPFESFYPQYSQLSAEQRACYIGFRTEVQSGRYPEVSRSYIYLYLYEIINLVSLEPRKRAETIASLINGYPDADDKLFSDMCNWLADICLIYQLKIPQSIYGSAFPRVLERAQIKEVFLDQGSNDGDERLAFMLTASRYDYKKSKFYSEFSEYYDKYIPKAVSAELEKLSKTDSRFSDTEKECCTLTRESYFGAFCIGAAKRTVSIELRCITRDETVKKTVSDMVKYAENRLRSELMIKPRLSVIYLPVSVRDGIKSFFAERAALFPKKHEKKVTNRVSDAIPEYEKLYEPLESGISEDAAREIEIASWETTERLVSAFDSEENGYTPPALSDNGGVSKDQTGESAVENAETKKADVEMDNLNSAEREPSEREGVFISALEALLLDNRDAFKILAKKSGMLAPAFADLINEFVFDTVGDSVISVDGEKIELIEDYREDVRAIVNEYRENG